MSVNFKLGSKGRTPSKYDMKKAKKSENKKARPYNVNDPFDVKTLFDDLDTPSEKFDTHYSKSKYGSDLISKQINPRLDLARLGSIEPIEVRTKVIEEVIEIMKEWKVLVLPKLKMTPINRDNLGRLENIIKAERKAIYDERKPVKDTPKKEEKKEEEEEEEEPVENYYTDLRRDYEKINSLISRINSSRSKSTEDKFLELISLAPSVYNLKERIKKSNIGDRQLLQVNADLESYSMILKSVMIDDYPKLSEVIQVYEPITPEAVEKFETPIVKPIDPDISALFSPVSAMSSLDDVDFTSKIDKLSKLLTDGALSIESEYSSATGSLIEEDSDGTSVIEGIDAKSEKKLKLGQLQTSTKENLDKLINEAILAKVPTITILSGLKQIFPLFNFSKEEEREYLTKIINKTTQSSLIKENAEIKQEMKDNAEDLKETFQNKSLSAVTLEPEFARSIKLDTHQFSSDEESSGEEEFIQPKIQKTQIFIETCRNFQHWNELSSKEYHQLVE